MKNYQEGPFDIDEANARDDVENPPPKEPPTTYPRKRWDDDSRDVARPLASVVCGWDANGFPATTRVAFEVSIVLTYGGRWLPFVPALTVRVGPLVAYVGWFYG